MNRPSGQGRMDSPVKVAGVALYPGDLHREGMAFAGVVWSDRAHARLIDVRTAHALRIPGVIGVLTASDVPVNEFGYMIVDERVLSAEKVRCIGDPVALVVATSPGAVEAGVSAVEVAYADLPEVFDPARAMAPGAPLVHDGLGTNILRHIQVRRGDAENALAKAKVVVEGTYRTQATEHAFLAPEAGLAYPDGKGGIVVESASQWARHDKSQIAHALALPEEKVEVIQRTIGGAFGGREDISLQILVALAAHRLGIPVKMVWSRRESIRGHHKRHPFSMTYRTGTDQDGRLVALQAELIADAGAYASTSTAVLGTAVLLATGPYEVPHVSIDGWTVYTNNLDNGAMRGFGAPQVMFAVEAQMNKLAKALGIDPVELRLRNVVREGSKTVFGANLPAGVGLARALEQAARAAGWRIEQTKWVRPDVGMQVSSGGPRQRRGIGVACGWKNVGFILGFPDESEAEVTLRGLGSVEQAVVRTAAAEMGQGVMTMIGRVAAGSLGVPMDRIEVNCADGEGPDAGSSSASRSTLVVGETVRRACESALDKWRAGERPAVARIRFRAPETTPFDPDTGRSDQPMFSCAYGAQVAEVEVDEETGLVQLRRVWSAHDIGQVVDPQGVLGQIEGGVVMAQGYALMENFVQRQGRILTGNLHEYLIPTASDAPIEIIPILVESQGGGSMGSPKGVAEMPVVMLAPAIAAAVHDAVGRWVDALPLTPERVLGMD